MTPKTTATVKALGQFFLAGVRLVVGDTVYFGFTGTREGFAAYCDRLLRMLPGATLAPTG